MKFQERQAVVHVPDDVAGTILVLEKKWASVLVPGARGFPDQTVRRMRVADLRPYDWQRDNCFACRKPCSDMGGEHTDGLTAEQRIARAEEYVKKNYGRAPPEYRRMALCRECMLKYVEIDRKMTSCSCPASWDGALVCTCAYRRAQPLPDFLRAK